MAKSEILQNAEKYVVWAREIVKRTSKTHESVWEGYGIDWYEISQQREPRNGHTAQNVVCFSPHADDAEFAAGVTLGNHVRDGDHVSTLLFTAGSAGRYSRGFTETTMPVVRIAESITAAQILGVQRFGVVTLPNGNSGFPEWFWIGKEPDVRRFSVALMRELNPHIIYAPHFDPDIDKHLDHQAVGQVALWAADWGTENAFYQDSYPGTADNFRELRMYAVWPGSKTLPVHRIKYYNPGDELDLLKRQALGAYKSQRGDLYALAAAGLARFNGVMRTVGNNQDQAAEVFDVICPPAVI